MPEPWSKPLGVLSIEDFKRNPVWEFVHEEVAHAPDIWVHPVTDLPVESLALRLVGTEVQLRNGLNVWATLSNISLGSKRITDQFLCLSVERDGQWFEMARYFDVDYERRGPQQLAEFLKTPIDGIFPIDYDISRFVARDYEATRGHINRMPTEVLSPDERFGLLRLLRPETP